MGNYQSLSQILLMFTAPLQFQQQFLVCCTFDVSEKKKQSIPVLKLFPARAHQSVGLQSAEYTDRPISPHLQGEFLYPNQLRPHLPGVA